MNGKEAIESVEERWNLSCCGFYHAIFMDISMPIMDGLEATKGIRSLEISFSKPHVPIIACTANSIDQEALIIEYLKAGFNEISHLT